MAIDLDSIRRAINESQAGWTAEDTPLLRLSDDEMRQRLGVQVDRSDLQRLLSTPFPFDPYRIAQELESEGRSIRLADLAEDLPPGAIPDLGTGKPPEDLPEDKPTTPEPAPAVDWRNRDGQNLVTPVRDQLGCGSCVAFGVLGTMESMMMINQGQSADFSEAELQFCGGASCAGWWPTWALEYLRGRGVAPEDCFPYQPQNIPCNPCSDRDQRAWQVVRWGWTDNAVIAQRGMTYVGPCIAVFNVYDDFRAYTSGVYQHVTGQLLGSHCVEVVGYDRRPGANFWIAKNSWGAGFGEGGFFRIAFGQCGMFGFVDGDDPGQNRYPSWSIYDARPFAQ